MPTYKLKDLVTEVISGEWGEELTEGNEGTKIIRTTNFSNVNKLAKKIEEELNKIKGFESARVEDNDDDYVVNGLEDIEMSFEEATGKKLELYIDSYVTRTEIEGR